MNGEVGLKNWAREAVKNTYFLWTCPQGGVDPLSTNVAEVCFFNDSPKTRYFFIDFGISREAEVDGHAMKNGVLRLPIVLKIAHCFEDYKW